MAELYFELSNEDQKDALEAAASELGRPAHLLEKDIWVVWALNCLFSSPFGEHLVFKGGTSLSKVHGAIERFSEDVDVTYDIRQLIEVPEGDGLNTLPPSNAQARRWTRQVREALPQWLEKEVVPYVRECLAKDKLNANAFLEDTNIFIEYPAVSAGTGYVAPRVLLEFGARSTGEPAEPHAVECDAASSEALSEITFPTATPRVMNIHRTFWEKATAIHVYCLQGRFRGGERYARHWYDLASLHAAGHAEPAIQDKAIRTAVADHKSLFFRESDNNGEQISYHEAANGNLILLPDGEPLEALKVDYEKMVEDGLFHGKVPSFDQLMEQCAILQDMVKSTCEGQQEDA